MSGPSGNSDNRLRRQALDSLDTLVNTSGPNYPVDSSGNPGTNSSRRRPYDAIYADVCFVFSDGRMNKYYSTLLTFCFLNVFRDGTLIADMCFIFSDGLINELLT